MTLGKKFHVRVSCKIIFNASLHINNFKFRLNEYLFQIGIFLSLKYILHLFYIFLSEIMKTRQYFPPPFKIDHLGILKNHRQSERIIFFFTSFVIQANQCFKVLVIFQQFKLKINPLHNTL